MTTIPQRGGFLRPFGTAQFIAEFLKGEGPKFGVTRIDPKRGAPQQDIHVAYKLALHIQMAEDAVAWEVEEAGRRGRPMTTEQMDQRRAFYLARIPRKLSRMRYHSFCSYFGMLKRLKWVKPTGEEEASEAQERMALAPGEPEREVGRPRIYYLLTTAGKRASLSKLSNPLRLLYPQFTAAYFRGKKKLYSQPRTKRA
jgi:hypothetical protein